MPDVDHPRLRGQLDHLAPAAQEAGLTLLAIAATSHAGSKLTNFGAPPTSGSSLKHQQQFLIEARLLDAARISRARLPARGQLVSVRAMWKAAVASIVIAVSIGCGPALHLAPSKGGPAWRELTSEHFTMWTSATPRRAREYIRELEHIRQVIMGVAFPGAPSSAKVIVIAPQEVEEMQAMSGSQSSAYDIAAQAPLWQPIMVVPTFLDWVPDSRTLAAHELTHLVSAMVMRQQPLWLSEGMADYFGTLELDTEIWMASVGLPQTDGVRPRPLEALTPVAELFAIDGYSSGSAKVHDSGLALFTFLINEHQAELTAYLQRLAALEHKLSTAEAMQLWQVSFPSLPLATVDAVLRQWLLRGKHTVHHFNVKLREWPVTERQLSDADVYAIHALLNQGPDRTQAQRAYLDAALAADPLNVLARAIASSLGDLSLGSAVARTIAAAHPDEA